jgi:hypothetical protein
VHTLGGTLLSETSDIVTAVQTAAPASQSTIADTSAPAQPTV